MSKFTINNSYIQLKSVVGGFISCKLTASLRHIQDATLPTIEALIAQFPLPLVEDVSSLTLRPEDKILKVVRKVQMTRTTTK